MREYTSPKAITSDEQMVYYLMNEDEVLDEIKKLVEETKELIGLSSSTMVRLLLGHFHWNKDVLLDRYWEDPDKLLCTLKLKNSVLSSSANSNSNFPSTQCMICFLEKPLKEFYAARCQHQICLACWHRYIESTINNHIHVHKISCPSKCEQILEDEQVLDLLSSDIVLRNFYQKNIINTFVETNRLTKWCPGNSCSTIVKLRSSSTDCACMISCDRCRLSFCFQCLKQRHDPIQCSLLIRWEKKNRDESMTCEWIISNTKPCPSCQSNIEKNGGCNHMTCRKLGCGYEFCWICLTSWKDHASRQCNVYIDQNTEKPKLQSRENLARYMHYFTRYQIHNQSLELEDRLSAEVEKRVLEMQDAFMSYTQQQAIYKAFSVLKECRRTLKYTYAFAYYLYRNNQAEVFEKNQADLENATELLSGFLEQEIVPDHDRSLKLMDNLHYCEYRQAILLDHCREGYMEHYWAGLDPY